MGATRSAGQRDLVLSAGSNRLRIVSDDDDPGIDPARREAVMALHSPVHAEMQAQFVKLPGTQGAGPRH